MDQFLEVCSKLAEGFVSSVLLFVLTLVIALPLGLLISFCTMSKFAPLSMLSKVLVWVLRGTPLMLQLFVVLYVFLVAQLHRFAANLHIICFQGLGTGHDFNFDGELYDLLSGKKHVNYVKLNKNSALVLYSESL